MRSNLNSDIIEIISIARKSPARERAADSIPVVTILASYILIPSMLRIIALKLLMIELIKSAYAKALSLNISINSPRNQLIAQARYFACAESRDSSERYRCANSCYDSTANHALHTTCFTGLIVVLKADSKLNAADND